MDDTESKIADLQKQIAALNDQVHLPSADIPRINKQIRALIAQQTELRTEALENDR